jgi:hypothetical protein
MKLIIKDDTHATYTASDGQEYELHRDDMDDVWALSYGPGSLYIDDQDADSLASLGALLTEIAQVLRDLDEGSKE